MEDFFTISWVKNPDGSRTLKVGWGFILMIVIGLYLLLS